MGYVVDYSCSLVYSTTLTSKGTSTGSLVVTSTCDNKRFRVATLDLSLLVFNVL
jgi:hypothetical protein